jgi:hypothetical protein
MKNKTNKQQQQTITILLEIMLGGINYIPGPPPKVQKVFLFCLVRRLRLNQHHI